MRRRTIAVCSIATLGLAAVPALAATKSIRVGDNWFVRASGVPTVTVKKGDTVRWRFVGDAPHNVSVTRGPVRFTSPVKRSGTYARRMTRRGTYTIICTIHGARDQSMRLRVR
ncbi:MAG TPA: hypothetical protein VD931_23535 [Baekduia sp.]|nr:hypothetical protein [Baekduia sp.]